MTRLPLMPAHFVALGAVQWVVFWIWLYPAVALAGAAAAVLLLVGSTWTSGLGLWGPFVSRGRRKGASIVLRANVAEFRSLAAAIRESGLPCAVFLSPEQAADHDGVAALLHAGCEVGLRFAPRTSRELISQEAARQRIEAGIGAFAASQVRPLVVLAPRSCSGPGIWPALVELACMGLRPALRVPRRVRDGSIVEVALGPEPVAAWKAFTAQARRAAVTWRPLSDLLRCPVLSDLASGPSHAAELFYDAQASSYDEEQQGHGQSGLRAVEQAQVKRALLEGLTGRERVLELGAGTGRFTSLLAARGCTLVATDASRQMLRMLERKAVREGWKVRAVHGELTGPFPEGPFDLVCSFSALEYATSLTPVLQSAARALEPGGTLYLTTAHASPFRLFTQVGNAMRQGVWLHARTVRDLRAELWAAGFDELQLTTHGWSLPGFGGMLLAAKARKARPE